MAIGMALAPRRLNYCIGISIYLLGHLLVFAQDAGQKGPDLVSACTSIGSGQLKETKSFNLYSFWQDDIGPIFSKFKEPIFLNNQFSPGQPPKEVGPNSTAITLGGPNVLGFKGGLGGLDYFLSKQANGKFCYTERQKATPDIVGGNQPAQTLAGYGEVAMLYRNGGAPAVCSAVLVGRLASALTSSNKQIQTYVLTAAHCVADGNKTTAAPVAVGDLDTQYLVLIPDSQDAARDPKKCFTPSDTNAAGCGYLVGQVQKDGSGLLAKFSEWEPGKPAYFPKQPANSRTEIVPDLALLQVKFTSPPTRYARLWNPQQTTLPAQLTQGGYGYQEKSAPGKLAVGRWGSLDDLPVPIEMGIATLKHDKNGAKACKGDSGGPVFAGIFNGAEPANQLRPVAAVIATVYDAGQSTTCVDGKGKWQNVQVFTQPIVDWLCKDKRTIFGCPGISNP